MKPPNFDEPHQETLVVCQHEKVLHTIGGFGIDPDKGEQLQVTIGITPIDDIIFNAQRIKYAIHGVVVGDFGPRGISMIDSGSCANPMKGLEGGITGMGDGLAGNQIILCPVITSRARTNQMLTIFLCGSGLSRWRQKTNYGHFTTAI